MIAYPLCRGPHRTARSEPGQNRKVAALRMQCCAVSNLRLFLSKRLSTNLGFVDFGDYFDRFLIQIREVIYEVDITPRIWIKKRPKEPQNRQKLRLWTVSKTDDKSCEQTVNNRISMRLVLFTRLTSHLFTNLIRC